MRTFFNKLCLINLIMDNIASMRRGRGVVNGLVSKEKLGRFVVCTMEIPWNLTKDKLGETPQQVIMVASLEEKVLNELVANCADCETVVGIGGGQAIDVAKYLSWKMERRLVSIPTIVSVDAFVTPAAGIRRNNDVVYVGKVSPNPLVIDYNLIRTAPPELNVAGIGDILSIHTAVFDWELAYKDGKSEYPFSMDDIFKAKENLTNVMSNLDEIANVTDKGIAAIVDGYLNINKVCLPAGHYRTEEGSEHYVFYALENKYKRPYVHGHIVGLGLYIMTRLQGNESDRIIQFMDSIGLRYHPVDLEIDREGLKEVLMGLRKFVEGRENLWYTVINKTCFSEELVEDLIKGLKFK